MNSMLLLHGGGRKFDLNDPVDQIILACLSVFLLCGVATFVVAGWKLKKGIGGTPACPECKGDRVSLRGIVGGESKDWHISDLPGWKWRCKICGAEFETMRCTDPEKG
jgi:hypothetical protein